MPSSSKTIRLGNRLAPGRRQFKYYNLLANCKSRANTAADSDRCVAVHIDGPHIRAGLRGRYRQGPNTALTTVGLTSVFDVTGDSIIDGFTGIVQLPVVMPVDVAIRIKVPANHRTGDIRSAVDRYVSRRRIKDG